MRDRAQTKPRPVVRLPRLVAGEWRCRDCGQLSYGRADDPRCPGCYGRHLVPTVEQPAERDTRPRRLAT